MILHKLASGLRRNWRGYRVDWRKLLLAVSILTTAGAMLQSCMILHPSAICFLLPPINITSFKNLNSKIEESKPAQAELMWFPPVSIASIDPVNSHIPVPHVEESLEAYQQNPAPKIRGIKDQGKENSNVVKALDRPIRTISTAGVSPCSRREKPVWCLKPDVALVYAKKEIANAPIVTEDRDLFTPVFRNVSVFKRSYDLMERILKVYIYRDGAKPIFHTPHLKGIYASEGWFMKLMEENKQFVARDPNKAHLFYLPYSARQLQLTLYVPDSHDIRPLSLFLKNYIDMISAKYPFWNRTRGSDHFLVACHDWGPYTLKEHKDLSDNTIKVLCNADVSEGIFNRGKDISLSETTIRVPKNPLRNIGGKPVSQRPILAFFAGNMHGRVRPKLLKYWGNKDPDMKIFGPLSNRISRKMTYVQHMKSSKFCICPMGYEVNSPRIVEAIYYECVPVIIADNFVLPFDEVLDWSKFSVVVAEKDIEKLKEILLAIPLRRYLSMQMGVKRVQKHFLWHQQPIKYDLFHMILHSIWFSRLNQIQIHQE